MSILSSSDREETESKRANVQETDRQEPDILEEIEIEDFAVDGICGVYWTFDIHDSSILQGKERGIRPTFLQYRDLQADFR